MPNLKVLGFSLPPFPLPIPSSTHSTSARRSCDRCSNSATSVLKRVDCGPHHKVLGAASTAMTPAQASPSDVQPMMNSSAAQQCADFHFFSRNAHVSTGV